MKKTKLVEKFEDYINTHQEIPKWIRAVEIMKLVKKGRKVPTWMQEEMQEIEWRANCTRPCRWGAWD